MKQKRMEYIERVERLKNGTGCPHCLIAHRPSSGKRAKCESKFRDKNGDLGI